MAKRSVDTAFTAVLDRRSAPILSNGPRANAPSRPPRRDCRRTGRQHSKLSSFPRGVGPGSITGLGMSFYDQLKWTADGLIPAIVQEAGSGRVLMMAWMNRASLETTIATGRTHFWSRSRQKFWMKGEESGHTQTVRDIACDCDGDTLLIQVDQVGAACHDGYKSCFFRSVDKDGTSSRVTESRLMEPGAIYQKKTN